MQRKQIIITLSLFFISILILIWINSKLILDTDDAYITYRYASNIVNGQGFTYNPGEKVLGTTTPLYTLMLASLAFIGFDIPAVSASLNVFFASLTVAITYLFVYERTKNNLAGLIAVLLLFTFSHFVIYSISGMETSLCSCTKITPHCIIPPTL